MEKKNQKRDEDEAQLEAHSLPGTNQAGRGPEIPEDKIPDESAVADADEDCEPVRPESAKRGGPKTAP